MSADRQFWRASRSGAREHKWTVKTTDRFGPMATLKRVAPIPPVRDLSASLAHYQRLGFATREYDGGAYGYESRDGVEIHPRVVPADGPSAPPPSGYTCSDDADPL